MPAWTPAAGQAFLVPSGRGGMMHMFVVLNDPVDLSALGYRKNVLYLVNVNLTSVHAGVHYDQSCVVQMGEHPAITHESYAYYRGMREYTVNDIKTKIESNEWPLQAPVSPELLEKLRSGARTSTAASREHQKLLAYALAQTPLLADTEN